MFTRAEDGSIRDMIVALERAALERWGNGDPGGYLELYAPDVTYFDPAVASRVDGYDAMEQYYGPIAGTVSVEHFELLDPRVQVCGDMAVLTFNLEDHVQDDDGAESIGNRWNVTEVYQRLSGEWKIVHAHFSYTERP